MTTTVDPYLDPYGLRIHHTPRPQETSQIQTYIPTTTRSKKHLYKTAKVVGTDKYDFVGILEYLHTTDEYLCFKSNY
ncbi:MAG: hypothetical protein HQK56_16260 [Deltaproteobacteria bacterium]|nr:hypothetical protein [Deltaproteobacteria bacterium]